MCDKKQISPLVAGVDEAGRGPLAGVVVAAAVILDPKKPIKGITDSKKMTQKKREELYELIIRDSKAYAIASANAEEIDCFNILGASLLAMQRAINQLNLVPDKVLVDGRFCPKVPYYVEAIVKGDSYIPAISAASILAKVERDWEMIKCDKLYPGYGFAQHKGYATLTHLKAIYRLGLSPIHRKSFRPVRQMTLFPPSS